jgi:hypothetical protein
MLALRDSGTAFVFLLGLIRLFGLIRGGFELGEFADHFAFAAAEADAAGVADGYAERAEDQVGALGVDLVAHYGVDGFH